MSARDRRYTITREFCGFIRAQHVVRFCDTWIASAPTRKIALEIRDAHAAERAAQRIAWQAEADALLAAVRFTNALHRARELQRSPAFLPA